LDAIDLVDQDGGASHSLATTPDVDEPFSTPITPATPITSIGDVKYDTPSKTPSRTGTPKSISSLKLNIQEAFAKGSANEDQMYELMGTQKHERVIGELRLKERRLEAKTLEKQYQREREREQQQHQLRMLQMQMMMTQGQNQRVFPAMAAMMQPPNQPPLDGFSLMPDLGEAALPSGSSSSLSSSLAPYSV
jgi:hypothetical protein